jgi:D-alanyl-D-alanine carboxypeptidase/D-alanyl-D-alanine-endopeptidase (penicillin-binding protein 4)
LQNKIQAQLDQEGLAAASFGVCVMTEKDRQIVFQQDANKLLMPASTMKLYTTAAALTKLTPDFRIRTSVYAAARPDANGHIKDLILYGRGDPSLDSNYDPNLTGAANEARALDLLAQRLAAAGVKQVDGDLIADESYFHGGLLGQGWEWMDLQWYFGAEVSALTAYDNSIEVTVSPGNKLGGAGIITITPDVGYVAVANYVQTVGAGGARDIGIERGLEDNTLVIWGTIPIKDNEFHSRVAIHKPAGFTAALFQAALNRVGIKIVGKTKIADSSLRSAARPADPEKNKLIELASVESLPLSEMVRIVNKFSHNLYAELLLRALGKLKGNDKINTDEAGADVVKEFLHTVGIDTSLLRIMDGSGLSRRALVSARATTQLLDYMSRQPNFEIFQNSLPIAAIDGTLARRMAGTAAARNVHAKTGTLTNTSALAGYATSAAGEPLVFCIMFNNLTTDPTRALAAENNICALLASFQGKLAEDR